MKTTITPTETALVSADHAGSGTDVDALGTVSITDIDNLDETVLGYAAVDDPSLAAPELARGTEHLTEWDEPAHASGKWTPRHGIDDDLLDADRLVEAGIEEADRERRVAAEATDDE